jgi:hypothetical protein
MLKELKTYLFWNNFCCFTSINYLIMHYLKILAFTLAISFILLACGSSSVNKTRIPKEEPVVIANDSLAYEIAILDIGFTAYLATTAKPEGFYSQNYLEARNKIWVINWNQRALNPSRFNQNIYENRIDYQAGVDYGYEVNYKLFNYFLFAQKKYKMNLGGGFRSRKIN